MAHGLWALYGLTRGRFWVAQSNTNKKNSIFSWKIDQKWAKFGQNWWAKLAQGQIRPAQSNPRTYLPTKCNKKVNIPGFLLWKCTIHMYLFVVSFTQSGLNLTYTSRYEYMNVNFNNWRSKCFDSHTILHLIRRIIFSRKISHNSCFCNTFYDVSTDASRHN